MRKTRKLRGGAQVDKIRMLQHAELRNEIDTLKALIEPTINQRSEIDALKLEVTRLIALSETHDKLLLLLCNYSANIGIVHTALFKDMINNGEIQQVGYYQKTIDDILYRIS